MYDSKNAMNDNYDGSIKIGLREVSRWNIQICNKFLTFVMYRLNLFSPNKITVINFFKDCTGELHQTVAGIMGVPREYEFVAQVTRCCACDTMSKEAVNSQDLLSGVKEEFGTSSDGKGELESDQKQLIKLLKLWTP